MKFITPTAKQSALMGIGALALNVWLLWSASMIPDVTTGITGFNDRGEPVISRIEKPNRSKGLFLGGIVGSVIAGIALARAKDEKGDRLIQKETLSDDIGSISKLVSNNAVCGLEFVSLRGAKFLFGKQSVTRQLAVKVLPVEIRDFVTAKVTRKNWLDDLLKEARHYVICGATGDGKSVLLNFILLSFIKRATQPENLNTDGSLRDRLAISDINYGKPDDKGDINNWMDIDYQFISDDIDKIMAVGRSIVAELRECKKAGTLAAKAKSEGNLKEYEAQKKLARKGNFLWIIEELIATRASMDSDTLKEFDAIRQEIRIYGRGYGFKMCEIIQYLNANDNGINLGQRQNICIVLLKSMASTPDTVKKIFSNHEELAARFNDYLKKFKYLAMVQLGGGDPQILEIPDLSWVSGVSLQSPSDPVSDWWAQIWTESNQQWIIDVCETGKSPISSKPPELRAEFKKRFKIELDLNDARYVRLKAAIEQIKSQVKTLTTV
jgi:hypothetical protein